MVDLSTTYLGLKLKNPLVPSASPVEPLARQRQTAGRRRCFGTGDVLAV